MELELIEPALFLDHARGRRRGLHPLGAERRSNSHCLIAEVRFGGCPASSRATSISATSAFKGQPRSLAASSSARQNIGSRLMDV